MSKPTMRVHSAAEPTRRGKVDHWFPPLGEFQPRAVFWITWDSGETTPHDGREIVIERDQEGAEHE